MADTVDTVVVRNGKRDYTVRLLNKSDGTGESGVTKVDISTLTAANGATCTYTSILSIDGVVTGGEVYLTWDHTTADEIAYLSGFVNRDFSYEGGLVDPKTAGGTGDILLTTVGFASGSGYDLTIRLRKKN
jgi:hypothetical protein